MEPTDKINKSGRGLLAWMGWLGLAVAAFLAGLALLLAALLAVYGEADYRRLLVWSADHFLAGELQVSGPLSVRYSDGVVLSVPALRLAAHDGSYTLGVDALVLHFQPASVFSGVLRVDALQLGDFFLHVNETAAGERAAAIAIPPLVIATARVGTLLVEYQEASPGTLHRFSLDDLLIDDANADGQAEVMASGVIEGQAFRLSGSLPLLDAVQDAVTLKPVRLEFFSEKMNLVLEGGVADPLVGTGMDLRVRARVDGVDEFLEIFGNEVPPLGRLELTALLRGDYATPRLEDIDLRLLSGESTDLRVSGTIADARTGEGARLQITAQTDNVALLSWLLFRQQERLSSVSLDAAFEIRESRYFVSGLDVDALTPEGLNLSISGSSEIFAAGHEFSRRDAAFAARIDAPRTSGFYMTNRRRFPDLGPIAGSAAMALSLDGLDLRDVEVSIGSRRGAHVSLQGDIGYIPLVEKREIRRTGLKLAIDTVDVAGLGRQFGRQWPDLGPAQLAGDIVIKGTVLRLENARFSSGQPGKPVIKANGSLATELNTGSSLDVAFEAAVADLLAAVTDVNPGYLGYVHGKTRISDMDGSWGIESISLASARTDIYRLDINGSFDDLEQLDQGKLKAAIAVNDMTALGRALGMNLSGYGLFKTEGTWLGSKGRFSYRGNTSLGSSFASTVLDGYLRGGKPRLSGKLVLPVLRLADVGLGRGDRRAEPAGEGGQVFSRAPLSTAFLGSLDLELDLAIDEVIGRAMRIDAVDGHVSIRGGLLNIAPLRLNFAGGRSDIVLSVRDANVPEYRIRIDADEVTLGSLLAKLQGGMPVRGSSSLHAELQASGRSLHQLASSLDGTVSIGLENVRVPREYVTFLSADVLGWVGSKSLFRDKYAELNCVMMSFGASDGRVASKTIIADGPTLSLGGRINLDLGDETLDVVLLPKQKMRVFSSISPVKISGPMSSPVVVAIPARAALQEIGTLVLMPGVAVSVKVFEELWSLLDKGGEPGEGCGKIEAIGRAAEKNTRPAAE